MLAEVRPIGAEIDRLFDMRAEIDELNQTIKEKKAVFAEEEKTILDRMDAEGTPRSGGKKANVSVTELVVPQVIDWDEFYKYISRNKAFHMLEKRPSAGAYREIMTQRTKPLPGVVPFTKRSLSLRTV
jgi:hypothetical protein